MSFSACLFDGFDNLDQIKIEDVIRWIKPIPPQSLLENYIANRILYPHTLSTSAYDMKMDLAILREAIRLSATSSQASSEFLGSTPFLNTTMRKIIIPSHFLDFVPDLQSLIWAFVDGLLLNRLKRDQFQDLWTVILSGENDQIVGSVLLPQLRNTNGIMEIGLEGKIYKIKAGTINFLPCLKERFPVQFSLSQGIFLGKDKGAIELYGGKMGLLIDGRL